MSNWHNQIDVTHALTSYLLLGNFYTATVTNNSFVTNSLVLTAMTLPVFNWSENTLAEQPAHFRLVGSVVDGFRLCYFTMGAFQNRFWRGQADGNPGEIAVDLFIFSERHAVEFSVN